jgi:cold shock CspA family protein
MARGTIATLKRVSRAGLIRREAPGRREQYLFFEQRDVRHVPFESLREGQVVELDLTLDPITGKVKAANVRPGVGI